MTSRRRFLVPLFLSMVAATACSPQETPAGQNGGGDKGGSGAGGGGGSKSSGGSGGANDSSGGAGGSAGSSAGGSGGGGGSGGTAGDAAAPGDGQGPSADDCTSSPKTLLCDPLGTMPKTIKETGLFPAAPDFTKHSAAMRGFTPDPPLWSDGMEKQRFMLLPAGKKIDNTDPKVWVFPVGTVFIKTFFDDSGAGGKPRPIETRMIRRIGTADDLVEFDYYLYQWNDAGTDANLLLNDRAGDDTFAPTVKITINRMVNNKPFMINNGQQFDHTLPSRGMCGDCHHDNGLTYQTFIGFDELRLNTKLTPGAAKTQLQEFQEAGIFMKAPKPGDPPPATITASDPNLLATLKFVKGNCVHCHNAKGKQFDLAPEVFVQNTVRQKTDAQSVMPPADWFRVFPGMPEKSVVYVQTRRAPLPMPTATGGDRLRPMPPIGVNDMAPDQAGLDAMKAWIMNLK